MQMLPDLMNRTIIKGKVDFARKQANQAIGIPDRNRADLHAARAAVVHAGSGFTMHRHNVGDAHVPIAGRRSMRDRGAAGAVHSNAQATHIKMSFREAIRCQELSQSTMYWLKPAASIERIASTKRLSGSGSRAFPNCPP